MGVLAIDLFLYYFLPLSINAWFLLYYCEVYATGKLNFAYYDIKN